MRGSRLSIVATVVTLSCSACYSSTKADGPTKAYARVWNSTGKRPVIDHEGIPHFEQFHSRNEPVDLYDWFDCFDHFIYDTYDPDRLFPVIYVGERRVVCQDEHAHDVKVSLGTIVPGQTKAVTVTR